MKEQLQSPADVPKAIFELGKNALRFIKYQFGPGWDKLPADPNGASITIYEADDSN